MITLSAYIPDYSEVRALLGVSEDELEDKTIGLRVFLRSLEETLNEISENLIDQFIAVIAIAAVDRSSAQARFHNAVQTFATYHVAADLSESLAQFSPKTISDGKAMVQRHADSPYKVTIDGILRGRTLALNRLKSAFIIVQGGTSGTTIPVFSGLAVSTPTADPVTGT